jgi:hypothetical protein
MIQETFANPLLEILIPQSTHPDGFSMSRGSGVHQFTLDASGGKSSCIKRRLTHGAAYLHASVSG